MKKKVWNVSVLDNPNRAVMGENDEFYTTDTEAFLVFELADANFKPKNALLTLINRNDKSVVSEVVNVVDGVIKYELREEVIAHYGNWRAQLVYRQPKDGITESYTSQPIQFVVEGHIASGQLPPPPLEIIESWELFMLHAQDFLDGYDGRLTNVENNKADQSDVDEVTAQLAQKVGLGKKAELEDLSADVLSAIEGGEGTEFNLLSIPQDKSVSPLKTTFAKGGGGVNLWDGTYHKLIMGGVSPHTVYETEVGATIIVPIEPNRNFHVYKNTYDYMTIGTFNKYPELGDNPTNFINRNGLNNFAGITDSDTKFLAIQVTRPSNLNYPSILQVEYGEQFSEYIPPNERILIDLDKKSVYEPVKEISPAILSQITNDVVKPNSSKFDFPQTLSTDEYAFMSFFNLEPHNEYTVVFKTDALTGQVNDSLFRLQVRFPDQPNQNIDAKHVGGGFFVIRDFEVSELTEHRIMVWNYMDEPLTVYDVRVGKNGVPVVLSNTQEQITDYNKYPPLLVWGHEYMYSWYEKVVAREKLKMVWSGDSTTLGNVEYEGQRRHQLAKKIMTLGGYLETDVESVNSGHGTQHTGNWLGGDLDEDKRTENGFLDQDMTTHSDMGLYVIGWGINDGSSGHFPDLTIDERISRFEANLNEGLDRIRGSMYNRTPDDLAIIITTPNSTNLEQYGLHPDDWHNKIRPIIQKACRDYKCAFVDIAARQYDHSFSDKWSTNGDKIHPTGIANLDYMSMFSDLLYPYLMHK